MHFLHRQVLLGYFFQRTEKLPDLVILLAKTLGVERATQVLLTTFWLIFNTFGALLGYMSKLLAVPTTGPHPQSGLWLRKTVGAGRGSR